MVKRFIDRFMGSALLVILFVANANLSYSLITCTDDCGPASLELAALFGVIAIVALLGAIWEWSKYGKGKVERRSGEVILVVAYVFVVIFLIGFYFQVLLPVIRAILNYVD